MKNIDLKPCPFCDHDKPELVVNDNYQYVDGSLLARYTYVRCVCCNARGPSYGCTGRDYSNYDLLPEFAAIAWNDAIVRH